MQDKETKVEKQKKTVGTSNQFFVLLLFFILTHQDK